MTEAQSEYVIVKRKPTRDMHANGRGWSDRGNTWSAMISASPRPETVLTDEEVLVLAEVGDVPAFKVRYIQTMILKKLGAA